MLTGNFAEIIHVVKQKLESNEIPTFSADELGNINLMLRGYIGLIQNGFKTQHDSSLLSAPYSSLLINLLAKLASIQKQKIKQKKQDLFENLMAELTVIFNQMDTIPILALSKSLHFKSLKNSKKLLHKQLGKCISDSTQGFLDIIRTVFEFSHQMKEQLIQLNKEFKVNELAVCQEQYSLVTTAYLKRMTEGYTLETDNNHCLSFIASKQFGDFF